MGLLIPRRVTESTTEVVLSGAGGGAGYYDPVDGDFGFQPHGQGGREIPIWTLEKARTYSIAAYRTNAMARAILDTYTGFCVGDSSLSIQCPDPAVKEVAEGFWHDPANGLARGQELWLRDHLLNGESAPEVMAGATSGITRLSVIDPSRVTGVDLLNGNPLTPSALHIRMGPGEEETRSIIQPDPISGRRVGQVCWWPSFRAVLTDRRGFPFLGPVLDWLDSYDTVLANLVDRTALARYLVWDVTVEGGQKDVDAFIEKRKGTHAPRSGTVEVHNDKVTWKPQSADVKSDEDSTTAGNLLTNVAAGTGLAKTWLAEPEHANRATSISMAEPVRRRVGGVQNLWLANQTDIVRVSVDNAVAAGRIPAEVTINAGTARERTISAAESVTLTGPDVAASDAAINAELLVNLAQALLPLQQAGLLSAAAARRAAQKGWEGLVGVPYSAELDDPEADVSKVADYVDANAPDAGTKGPLAMVGAGA